MPKAAVVELSRYRYTQNRELSWLRFNRRVLEEAADESVPLLERLKFIAIFTSNLDEFFMVRVGSLYDLSLMSPDETDNKTGYAPVEQLEKIYDMVPGLIEIKNRLYATVSANLKDAGVVDLSFDALAEGEKKYVTQYFKSRILPILSPQIVDSHHPFPHLGNKALYIASLLREKKRGRSDALGFIPVPPSLPSIVQMPDSPGRFIRMENVILHWADSLFGEWKAQESCVLCATRNADISFDDEKFDESSDDFLNQMSKLLKKRSRLSIVRLELSKKPGDDFLKLLKGRIDIGDDQIYVDSSPLVMSFVYALEKALPKDMAAPLQFKPYQPRWPEDLDVDGDIIPQIFKCDRLLSFPYDSVEPFLRILKDAAQSPRVVSIKITIYRLSSTSKVVPLLCLAAENGKDVTVLMELRARFDEANNISWSRMLEDAGCRVIYGVENFKCHSKLCLITLQYGESLRYITQVGTGNYNEKTNAMYTDLSLMTASEAIGRDATHFFQNMLVGNLDGKYDELLVSPHAMKSALIHLIDEQIALGQEGYICIKANSLTERVIIDKLSEASRAGVQIRLILRGICCLLPGIPALTDNVQVTSIVGRYLEHARIYCFGNGSAAKYYISSADLMTRNLNRRVEVACPVHDSALCAALRWILDTQLADNVKASTMLPDGSYYRKTNSLPKMNAQEAFMLTSTHIERVSERKKSSVLDRLKRALGI